ALDLLETRANALAEVVPLAAADRRLGLRGQHVGDVLLAPVAAEAAQDPVVGELLGGGLVGLDRVLPLALLFLRLRRGLLVLERDRGHAGGGHRVGRHAGGVAGGERLGLVVVLADQVLLALFQRAFGHFHAGAAGSVEPVVGERAGQKRRPAVLRVAAV